LSSSLKKEKTGNNLSEIGVSLTEKTKRNLVFRQTDAANKAKRTLGG